MIFTDTIIMVINGTSMVDALATMATIQASHQVQNEITMAILKEQMDAQKQQGEALVQMIRGMSVDGTGQLINRIA